MNVEIRADGVHINGYVNVPGRESRPIATQKHGQVIEIIEQRAFQRAIEKAPKIDLKLDHGKVIASTEDKTLTAYEDAVGLRAESLITDPETVQAAKDGKLKGWSFGMCNIVDTVEQRANQLPLRKVKDFDMPEITLVLNKVPCYSSTSIEVRAEGEVEMETRSDLNVVTVSIAEKDPPVKEKIDYSDYENRISKIKSV